MIVIPHIKNKILRLKYLDMCGTHVRQFRLGKVRLWTSTADKIIDHLYRLKIEFFSLYVALKRCVNCSTVSTSCHFFVNWLNPDESGLTQIKQLIIFMSSSWFPAKSGNQLIVEQSNFEQLIPTQNTHSFRKCISLTYLRLLCFIWIRHFSNYLSN